MCLLVWALSVVSSGVPLSQKQCVLSYGEGPTIHCFSAIFGITCGADEGLSRLLTENGLTVANGFFSSQGPNGMVPSS
ncbi:MAG: hypothetical protein ACI9R3_002472 [Verrucomicrobiales bacterium]|jgi:hypothetical protein